VCIVRAPGRVNLMGRHVDHQGGHVNPLAIDREVILVASPRDDDVIRLVNVRPREFPDREFKMSDLLGNFNWDDWLSYVDSPQVRQLVRDTAGTGATTPRRRSCGSSRSIMRFGSAAWTAP